jgi:hypothetical protein
VAIPTHRQMGNGRCGRAAGISAPVGGREGGISDSPSSAIRVSLSTVAWPLESHRTRRPFDTGLKDVGS